MNPASRARKLHKTLDRYALGIGRYSRVQESGRGEKKRHGNIPSSIRPSHLWDGAQQVVHAAVAVGPRQQAAARELAEGGGELREEDLVVVVGVKQAAHAPRKLVQAGQTHPVLPAVTGAPPAGRVAVRTPLLPVQLRNGSKTGGRGGGQTD